MTREQTIVVGGGIAGLMCAATLARAGRAVTVLEASSALGGRGATRDERGFRLNLGGHALYRSDERRLRAVGVRVHGGHPRPDRGAILLDGGLSAWPLPPRVARSALGVADRAAVLRALAGVVATPTRALSGRSAADWIEDGPSAPRASALLAALLRISSYGARLPQMPAEIAVGMLRAATLHPVRYLDGGWASIVDGLAARVRAAGGTIETGVRVTGLLGDCDRRVKGVRVADGPPRRVAAVVLAGISPHRVARLLAQVGGELPATVGEPVTAACLDVTLRRLPPASTEFVLGVDEPLYLSTHSEYAALAPRDGAVVHAMRYDDGHRPPDRDVRERLEALLDLAQPGWREQLVRASFAPRLVVNRLLPTPAGGLHSRPGVADTGVPGVLLAGDWVGPEGWLVGGSLASGAAAADAVLAARTPTTPGHPTTVSGSA